MVLIASIPDISYFLLFYVFSLLEFRKRKSRSHGERPKGNDKCKWCAAKDLTLPLMNKVKGKLPICNAFISSFLPIPGLCILNIEAKKFSDRNHQMFESALLTRCYTQHPLLPLINSEIYHKRHYIKIPFINKGIDFIDLPGIYQNKSVTTYIPEYFQNS